MLLWTAVYSSESGINSGPTAAVIKPAFFLHTVTAQEIPFPPFMTHKATSLIKRLLDVNDKTRLGSGPNGAKDIKAHPFFDGTLPKSCGILLRMCSRA
jgi:hypothetical protein